MNRRRSDRIGMLLPALMVLAWVIPGCHRDSTPAPSELNVIVGGDASGGDLTDSTPAPSELKVIRPEFPKPVFLSGPWDCTLPNLEKRGLPPPKEFTGQADTEIISLNKAVTSSAPPSKGQIEWITDDELFCGPNGEHAVYFETLPCWVQIDLGAESFIDHIWLWHDQGTLARRATPEVFEDVIVQLSSDAEFRAGVITLFNSDDDGSCGQGKGTDPTYVETNHGRGVPAKGQEARFVRVWGGKAYSGGPCRFTEVTVWGR